MKNAWDSYLARQLANPVVRQAYEQETKVLSGGMNLDIRLVAKKA